MLKDFFWPQFDEREATSPAADLFNHKAARRFGWSALALLVIGALALYTLPLGPWFEPLFQELGRQVGTLHGPWVKSDWYIVFIALGVTICHRLRVQAILAYFRVGADSRYDKALHLKANAARRRYKKVLQGSFALFVGLILVQLVVAFSTEGSTEVWRFFDMVAGLVFLVLVWPAFCRLFTPPELRLNGFAHTALKHWHETVAHEVGPTVYDPDVH